MLEVLAPKNHSVQWKKESWLKIKETQREVSQPSELRKDAMKSKIPKNYNKLTIPEALETAKQRLIALATRLRSCTRGAEARRLNRMFSTEQWQVYAQWQSDKMSIDPPRDETEQYWKSIWEREALQNTNALWLVDVSADPCNLPTVTSDHPRKSFEHEELDCIRPWHNTHLLAKETNCTPWTFRSTNEPAANGWDHPSLFNSRSHSPDYERSLEGGNTFNYHPITCLCTTWMLL